MRLLGRAKRDRPASLAETDDILLHMLDCELS